MVILQEHADAHHLSPEGQRNVHSRDALRLCRRDSRLPYWQAMCHFYSVRGSFWDLVCGDVDGMHRRWHIRIFVGIYLRWYSTSLACISLACIREKQGKVVN